MAGPSDLEQLMLEYINETRLDPMGNAARYMTSYAADPTSSISGIQSALNFFNVNGPALLSAFQALVPTGPLAWNDALGTAAEKHSAQMITAQLQSHQVPGELDLGARVTAEGYNFQRLGENIFAYTDNMLYGHAGFMIDWGNGPNGMQDPAGHRINMMDLRYTEIGIDVTAESTQGNPLGPYVVTEDLGTRGKLFVLGVAYTDSDANRFYSVGEGRADLTVQIAAASATSTTSGGYTLETTAGAKTITLSGGGLSGAVTVSATIGTENLKLDVVGGNTLQAWGSVSVSGPITVLRGLGARGLSLTTAGGVQTIHGTSGNDTIDGGAGADQLGGGLGNDSYKADNQGDIVYEAIGAGTDSVTSTASYYLFANVENLTLTAGAGNIFGVGNVLANVLNGNDGENLLVAGAGNDEVHGGAARDAIFGEDGTDNLFGDAGIDYIVAGIGNDTVDGGTDADEIYGEAGDDIISGGAGFFSDILVGGDGNDTIYGNLASGAAGGTFGELDYLYGNLGNDTFHVDTPFDIVFEQQGEGSDTVYANIAGAGFYLYENIETLILEGTTPFGVGNTTANTITGNAIGNFLLGGAGDDTLNGKAGGDVLFGESGADTFVFESGTGGDVIGDFAAGSDKIKLAGIFADFAAAQANFIQNGNVGAINLGNGDLVVLHNVTMSQLTATDFLFG